MDNQLRMAQKSKAVANFKSDPSIVLLQQRGKIIKFVYQPIGSYRNIIDVTD